MAQYFLRTSREARGPLAILGPSQPPMHTLRLCLRGSRNCCSYSNTQIIHLVSLGVPILPMICCASCSSASRALVHFSQGSLSMITCLFRLLFCGSDCLMNSL